MGKTFTYPMRLQLRKHFSVESFYITQMEPQCDVILPLWWIAKHPPSKPYRLPEHIRFPCKNCVKEKSDKFTPEYDTEILDHPEALVVGSVAMTESNDDSLDSVPNKFKKWIHIKSKEARPSPPWA
jgi:hypothetical protein